MACWQIREYTIAEAHRMKEDGLDMTVHELKAFIALNYICGAFGGRGVGELLLSQLGIHIFKGDMFSNRFQEMMPFLHFDRKEIRRTTSLPWCPRFGKASVATSLVLA